MAPQNIPRAINVMTLGNKVILYCILYFSKQKKNIYIKISRPPYVTDAMVIQKQVQKYAVATEFD